MLQRLKNNTNILVVALLVGAVAFFITGVHNVDLMHNYGLMYNDFNMEKCPSCNDVRDIIDCSAVSCFNVSDGYASGVTLLLISMVMLVFVCVYLLGKLWE